MTTKKPLNEIERADVFGDLSQFRDTAAEAVEAVKRTLNRVPLMKAQGGGQKAGSFVRVHPTFELMGVGLVRDPREGGESHLVMKAMVKPLAKWLEAIDLHVAITREGFEHLAGPSDRQRQNRQAQSALSDASFNRAARQDALAPDDQWRSAV